MTCETYQRAIREDNKRFEKWKKEKNVKYCPPSKVLIEKAYGCNHMNCTNCQAHICWVCLKTFGDSEACYQHLQGMHGDSYNNGYDSDDEEDDEEEAEGDGNEDEEREE